MNSTNSKRSQQTLKDEERQAIEATIFDLEGGANYNEQRSWPMLLKKVREQAATLRDLLERTAMTDILDDYFDWRDEQEDRIGTHSDDCHMWPGHERCMIHRLAKALESARFTDEERQAVEWCAEMATVHATDCDEEITTLRGLLERTK